MLESIDRTKCCNCGSTLVERDSIFFCDTCHRVAFPYTDSKMYVISKYKDTVALLNELIQRKQDLLHRIDQKVLDHAVLTLYEKEIYETLSKYNTVKGDIDLSIQKGLVIREQDQHLFSFFSVAEKARQLLEEKEGAKV